MVISNPLIRGLDTRRLEGGLANQESVHDHTHRPRVNFERVTIVADGVVEDLGCDVVGSAADGALALIDVLQLSGQTEITDAQIQILVQEQIAELQI